MRVISVRLFPKECRLEAYVRHEDKLLMVPLVWMAREPSPVAPDHWYDTVIREVTESLTRTQPKDIMSMFKGKP
jgi:hypothetical protein